MNYEIIDQLAEQSGYIDWGNFEEPQGTINHHKFAELIIKECVLEAMDAIHNNNSIRIQVYKHFGIE